MPTLDDTPTLATALTSSDDLIPVYDLMASGSSKVRKIPLNHIMGFAPTGDVASPATAPTNITARVTPVTGGTTTALPPAAGILRDIIVLNQQATGLTVTAPSIFTSAVAGSQTSISIPANVTGRFMSNGSVWYRTH